MLKKLALASTAIALLMSTASADYYIVQEKATLRNTIIACENLISRCMLAGEQSGRNDPAGPATLIEPRTSPFESTTGRSMTPSPVKSQPADPTRPPKSGSETPAAPTLKVVLTVILLGMAAVQYTFMLGQLRFDSAEAAHERQMGVIALTGKNGGTLGELLGPDDVHVCVPHANTARIQEVHILCLHCMCDAIDCLLLGVE